MIRRGSRWLGLVAVCGLLLTAAGCGSNTNVDPVVTPKENQKDQVQTKPVSRGTPQSSDNLTPSGKINNQPK